MRAVILAATLIFIAGLSTACNSGASTEELASKVRADIEQKWASQPELTSARIKSFSLVHKGGQQYRGLLEADQDGESVTVAVDVTYDGNTFMWEIEQ